MKGEGRKREEEWRGQVRERGVERGVERPSEGDQYMVYRGDDWLQTMYFSSQGG